MSLPSAAEASALSSRFRWLSGVEFLLGAAIVIGHNVYHVVPNEVPILFVLGLLSFRLRDGGWRAMRFRRPRSWKRTVLIALTVAALRLAVGELVVVPLASRVWVAPVEAAVFDTLTGDIKEALATLALVWTFAAFGEEISYRGYLLNRAADALGRSTAAYWIALLAASVLFGLGHYYKGPSGVVDSGFAGLVLGAAYVLSGRNLWVPILAHGFIDTFAIVIVFFGWAT